MKKTIKFCVLATLVLAFLVSAAAAGDFDVEAFKANVVSRVRTQHLPASMVDKFDATKVEVEYLKAATIGNVDYYAVKMVLKAIDEAQNDQTVMMVVDESGKYTLPAISDVATGGAVTDQAMMVLSAVMLPDSAGSVVATGSGKNDLLIVSDPLCPYCKRSWAAVKAELLSEAAKTRLVHFPLSFHPGSDAACLAMFWAEGNDSVKLVDVVDFAYTDMKPAKVKPANPRSPSKEDSDKAGAEIIAQFLAKFPEMSKALGSDPAKALEKLRADYSGKLADDREIAAELQVQGTPTFFVVKDGKTGRVEQFNPDIIKGMLK